MAVYVCSDIHGHVEPLKRLCERIGLREEDRWYCLGDMIDRGPHAQETIDFVRSLPQVTILKGNHEELLCRALKSRSCTETALCWLMNGGVETLASFGISDLEEFATYEALIGWLNELPYATSVCVGERTYILAHAGIRFSDITDELCQDPSALLAQQSPLDLCDIRESFWCYPEELIPAEMPCIVAGHTPTPYIHMMRSEDVCSDSDGYARIAFVGAHRIGIDCLAAGGFPHGRIGVLRLDDLACFYEPIKRGE